MERVGALIDKLKDQYEQRVDKNNLLITVQMLLSELQAQEQSEPGEKKKVSVIVPKVKQIVHEVSDDIKQQPVIPVLPEEKIQEEKKEHIVEQISPLPEVKSPSSVDEMIRYAKQTPENIPIPKAPAKEETPNAWLFNTTEEVPTLVHQKEVYELNDVHINEDSLNNKLKQEKSELGSTLQEAPIRDLRKAIGINDRYRFINDLFRGDETMYERSIKTINGFNIHAEAEYWIQRELKLKLGWPEGNDAVKLFDQTVKRRFS